MKQNTVDETETLLENQNPTNKSRFGCKTKMCFGLAGIWAILGVIALIVVFAVADTDTFKIVGLHGPMQQCFRDTDCNHGSCERDGKYPEYLNATECVCDKKWINHDGIVCSYEQRDQLVGFLLSLFLGYLGVDWFYLARSNGWYIFAGIMKLITCGGCGIWWIVDWARLIGNIFDDGNGIELNPW